MLDSFAADQALVLDDDPRIVSALVSRLVELGVWTIGIDEAFGGGGADHGTTAVAFERLGRHWPALGWASGQAHAALGVLAGDGRFAGLVDEVSRGEAAIGVVVDGSAHVRAGWENGEYVGEVDRVDVAAEEPHLLVLTAPDSAVLVRPDGLTFRAVRSTGLDGGLTRSVGIRATGGAVERITGVEVTAARARMWRAAAAVAAGIAVTAADEARAYATERHQFGGPLTAIPTVRQALLAQASRAAGAWQAAVSATDDFSSFHAARAACDAAVAVAAEALQSHGGYGYLTEYPAERRLRDAISLRAVADLQTAAVDTALALVGLPGSPVGRR
jgi:alkylation response protein AidB-like acyl-CoA dehydrogenase